MVTKLPLMTLLIFSTLSAPRFCRPALKVDTNVLTVADCTVEFAETRVSEPLSFGYFAFEDH
jgi:hypothetical protein